MKDSTISIRRATMADIHIFAEIKAEAYSDDRKKTDLSEDQKPSWYDEEWYVGLGILNQEEAKRIINEHDSYLIQLERKEIGGLWLLKDSQDSLTLEDFCILPQYQNKGYGTVALDLLEKMYPDYKVWKLDTPKFCVRNQHLYEKMGYEKTGMVANNTVVLYEKHIK